MARLWTWVKRIGVAIYVLIAGAAGGGGPVIVDRRQMYGDDPTNDPYSIEFDPAAKSRQRPHWTDGHPSPAASDSARPVTTTGPGTDGPDTSADGGSGVREVTPPGARSGS